MGARPRVAVASRLSIIDCRSWSGAFVGWFGCAVLSGSVVLVGGLTTVCMYDVRYEDVNSTAVAWDLAAEWALLTA